MTHPSCGIDICIDSFDLCDSHGADIEPATRDGSKWNEVVFSLDGIQLRKQRQVVSRKGV